MAELSDLHLLDSAKDYNVIYRIARAVKEFHSRSGMLYDALSPEDKAKINTLRRESELVDILYKNHLILDIPSLSKDVLARRVRYIRQIGQIKGRTNYIPELEDIDEAKGLYEDRKDAEINEAEGLLQTKTDKYEEAKKARKKKGKKLAGQIFKTTLTSTVFLGVIAAVCAAIGAIPALLATPLAIATGSSIASFAIAAGGIGWIFTKGKDWVVKSFKKLGEVLIERNALRQTEKEAKDEKNEAKTNLKEKQKHDAIDKAIEEADPYPGVSMGSGLGMFSWGGPEVEAERSEEGERVAGEGERVAEEGERVSGDGERVSDEGERVSEEDERIPDDGTGEASGAEDKRVVGLGPGRSVGDGVAMPGTPVIEEIVIDSFEVDLEKRIKDFYATGDESLLEGLTNDQRIKVDEEIEKMRAAEEAAKRLSEEAARRAAEEAAKKEAEEAARKAAEEEAKKAAEEKQAKDDAKYYGENNIHEPGSGSMADSYIDRLLESNAAEKEAEAKAKKEAKATAPEVKTPEPKNIVESVVVTPIEVDNKVEKAIEDKEDKKVTTKKPSKKTTPKVKKETFKKETKVETTDKKASKTQISEKKDVEDKKVTSKKAPRDVKTDDKKVENNKQATKKDTKSSTSKTKTEQNKKPSEVEKKETAIESSSKTDEKTAAKAPTKTSTPRKKKASKVEIEPITLRYHNDTEYMSDESLSDKEYARILTQNRKEEMKGKDLDDQMIEAARIVAENGTASIGLMQREFRIGYMQAKNLIDRMVASGLVEKTDAKHKKVNHMTPEIYDKLVESVNQKFEDTEDNEPEA